MELQIDSPIFIVGTGRSGTTLLSALLSAHSRIAITPETHFLKRVAKHCPLENSSTRFEDYWRDYTSSGRFRDLKIDEALCRNLIESSGDFSARAAFASLLEAFRIKQGKVRIGEKTPSHRIHAHTLLRWFPNARILVMKRDPRGIVASQLKCPWVKVQPPSLLDGLFLDTRTSKIIHYARNWNQAFDRDLPAFIDDPRVMLVQYEDLVKNSQDCLRQICAFVGEEFEPEMLHRRTEDRVTCRPADGVHKSEVWNDWTKEHHAKTRQPISTASLTKWRKELTPAEVAIIEGTCEYGMIEAGYEFTTPSWKRTAGRVHRNAEEASAALEQQARSVLRRVRQAATAPRRAKVAVG